MVARSRCAGLLPEAFGPQDLAALANKAVGSAPDPE